MANTFEIKGKEINYVLSEPQKHTDRAILYISGASGKATDQRFNFIEDAFKNDFAVFRPELWHNETELKEKNIKEVYLMLDDCIKYINSKGYSKIYLIGKSIGGGICLTYRGSIEKMILLAPAIGFGEKSNLAENKDKSLSQFLDFNDIIISKSDLPSYPILVLYGLKDKVVKYETLKKIAEADNISLETCEFADHGYKTEKEQKFIKEKRDFFS